MITDTSTSAIFEMCKHAVFVLEHEEGSRKATLRGITSGVGKYRIHLASMSQYFTDEEGEWMHGRSVIINNKSYYIEYIDGWLELTESRVNYL